MEGYIKAVEEILQKLALDVVMADHDGGEKLEAIAKQLDELNALSEEQGQQTFVGLVTGIKTVVDSLAAGNHPDPEQGITVRRES